MNEYTTISLRPETKELLFKNFWREGRSWDDVLTRLSNDYTQIEYMIGRLLERYIDKLAYEGYNGVRSIIKPVLYYINRSVELGQCNIDKLLSMLNERMNEIFDCVPLTEIKDIEDLCCRSIKELLIEFSKDVKIPNDISDEAKKYINTVSKIRGIPKSIAYIEYLNHIRYKERIKNTVCIDDSEAERLAMIMIYNIKLKNTIETIETKIWRSDEDEVTE